MRESGIALCLVLAAAAGLSTVARAEDPVTPSVTTTWAPDPFPNAAPWLQTVHAVADLNTPTRTPSVLYLAYDVENDALRVTAHGQARHGSVRDNGDGSFTYTPKPDFAGSDSFDFTVTDARGGVTSALMHVHVVRPDRHVLPTYFTGLTQLHAGEQETTRRTMTPRFFDVDGDGLLDVVVGVDGEVRWRPNTGTAKAPTFGAAAPLTSASGPITFGKGRVAIALADMDGDGRIDLVATPASDRRPQWYRNTAEPGKGLKLADAVTLGVVAANERVEVADFDGDGRPDILTGTGSGSILLARNIGKAQPPKFAEATATLNADGVTLQGSYNLNPRVIESTDGQPTLLVSYNWGSIQLYGPVRTARQHSTLAKLPDLIVRDAQGRKVDLHGLTDGPLVDVGDLNDDGTLDMVIGGERAGTLRIAFGVPGEQIPSMLKAIFAQHPNDLDAVLRDKDGPLRERVRDLNAALYDFINHHATPVQKRRAADELLAIVGQFPQYFRHQAFPFDKETNLPALAAQMWTTLLSADYFDPQHRQRVADAVGFTDAYRKLVIEDGLVYIDNLNNPRGAEAIHQWVRTLPRHIYPGELITSWDWMGDMAMKVRGHAKNVFNGKPVDTGEYAFDRDARDIIGERGLENWFMTVVKHEASHDLDAYVRRDPLLQRRWGQTLVNAGGPDMRADPATGWYSEKLTQEHFKQSGLWDGDSKTWKDAWSGYWSKPPGSDWKKFGYMRGGIDWLLNTVQESLATQGNQYFNTTEGRIEVAIARWRRGYRSNLGEVLLFLEIWSAGLDKIKFYENDTACNQVIRMAMLHRNASGYIDRVELPQRVYEFTVDADGQVTNVSVSARP